MAFKSNNKRLTFNVDTFVCLKFPCATMPWILTIWRYYYMSFRDKNSFNKQDLVDCGQGKLFGEGNPKLPVDKMLMVDRITHVSKEGGTFGKGQLIAELDINPELWFFDCHFIGDPVMPGCLGLDAMWQLVGFYLGWRGNSGKGRALGAGEIKFTGQVLPSSHLVTYTLNFKRLIERKLVMGIADGEMAIDGEVIYTAKDLRVGLFSDASNF